MSVYLNEGDKQHYAFGKPVQLKANGKLIQVPHGDAGPCVADWDGDGLLDLIVGCGDGSVIFYRNTGTAKEPKLDEGQVLIPPGAIEYDGPSCVFRKLRRSPYGRESMVPDYRLRLPRGFRTIRSVAIIPAGELLQHPRAD